MTPLQQSARIYVSENVWFDIWQIAINGEPMPRISPWVDVCKRNVGGGYSSQGVTANCLPWNRRKKPVRSGSRKAKL
jgi:hypothetical protein